MCPFTSTSTINGTAKAILRGIHMSTSLKAMRSCKDHLSRFGINPTFRVSEINNSSNVYGPNVHSISTQSQYLMILC